MAATSARAPRPSSLYDVLDLILDKGLVIDAYVRVSVVGIELVTIDARVVIASVDTYLRFAEATNRLDLREQETQGLPGMVQELRQGGAKQKTSGVIEGVKEAFTGGGGDEDGGSRSRRSRAPQRRRRSRDESDQNEEREQEDEE